MPDESSNNQPDGFFADAAGAEEPDQFQQLLERCYREMHLPQRDAPDGVAIDE